MEEAIINIIESAGYWGIALLIFIENIFPPIPSEAVLLFGGFAVTAAKLNPWLVILSATAGSFSGALVLYGAGRWLGKERIKRILNGKAGKILRFKPETVDKADEWFCKYRFRATFFCRCIPVVRSVISVPAGMSKMPFAPFCSLTVLGSTVWNTVLVWLGVAAGNAWKKVADYLGVYSKIVLAALILAAIGAVLVHKFRKKRKA